MTCRQLMQSKVQKSTSTALPRSDASETGAVLSHRVMPARAGAGPQSPDADPS
jgi:hypothetical protein